MTGDDSTGFAGRVLGDRPPFVLLAASAVVALAVLSPIGWLVVSALDVPTPRALALLTSASTTSVLLNSVALVAAVTAGSVALGVPLAVLTARTDLPGRRFWTVVLALPLVVPSYLGAFAYTAAFGPNGQLADALAPLGVDTVPSVYGFAGAAFVLTLYVYPYVFLSTRATLLSIDTSLVEAARTLGDAPLAAFRRVTLPQIAPGITAGALLVALYALSDFGTPAIMHVDVFTRVIYVEYSYSRDTAALLSVQLLFVTAIILSLESRVSAGQRSGYASSRVRATRRVRLGWWTAPALLLCAGVVALSLAVPVGVFIHWLFQSSLAGVNTGYGFSWAYAANSVYAAALTAGVAVLAALPVGYLSGRYDSRLGRLVERATYAGYAVPGIVIALALVYVGVVYVRGLYQTLPLLVFAYVVRFLPQAVGTTRSSVVQVDQRLVEAARTLGDAPLAAFRRVTLPLVLPGVSAGAALVFLTTMKELPATLLLQPGNFETLVTYIWSARESGFYGRVAVPALVLIGVSALSMLVILARERLSD
ncbi:ABC transporter permease [Halocalculus aciditolerans]|uniref:Iron ABC transporter permease n=1 Tax=Halocalculus aciditolerans TaxID=1383812 RepID=A0A830FID5_9EURY|nr:iron ABC transporter permease [Halocalculus aciditolerans]GGL55686.1 iron ABC transporter permease [Halocalculus aciditolerans]